MRRVGCVLLFLAGCASIPDCPPCPQVDDGRYDYRGVATMADGTRRSKYEVYLDQPGSEASQINAPCTPGCTAARPLEAGATCTTDTEGCATCDRDFVRECH